MLPVPSLQVLNCQVRLSTDSRQKPPHAAHGSQVLPSRKLQPCHQLQGSTKRKYTSNLLQNISPKSQLSNQSTNFMTKYIGFNITGNAVFYTAK
jgi:hypothetical protein